jgi:hypothetical protein
MGILSQNIFAPKPSDIISGDELSRVAKEILSAATIRPHLKETTSSRYAQAINTDIKLYSPGADLNVARQTAINQAGYDVALSQNAQNNINALKAMAAQSQIRNLANIVDGKIHINHEPIDLKEFKSVFMSGNNDEVHNTSDLSRDRRGSGGFYIPYDDNEEEKDEGLNLVI